MSKRKHHHKGRRRCVRVDSKGRFSKTGHHRKCFTVRKHRKH